MSQGLNHSKMADDDDWMNADNIQVPKEIEVCELQLPSSFLIARIFHSQRNQIPLPPALVVPTYTPGPSAAGGGGAAAPKHRFIAVEFDDKHNEERVRVDIQFARLEFA